MSILQNFLKTKRANISQLRRYHLDLKEVWDSDLLSFGEKVRLIQDHIGRVSIVLRELQVSLPTNNLSFSSDKEECAAFINALAQTIKELDNSMHSKKNVT